MKIIDLRTLDEDISWSQLKNKKPLLYQQWIESGLTKDDFNSYANGANGGKKFNSWEQIRSYISANKNKVQATNSNAQINSDGKAIYRTGYNKDGSVKGFTTGDLDATASDQNGYKTIQSNSTLDAIDAQQDIFLNAFQKKTLNPTKVAPIAGGAIAIAIDIATDSKAGTNMRNQFGDNFMITFINGYKWEELKNKSNEFIPWLRTSFGGNNSLSKDDFVRLYNMYLDDELPQDTKKYTTEQSLQNLVKNKDVEYTDKKSLSAWINSLPNTQKEKVRDITNDYINNLKNIGVDRDFEKNAIKIK